MPRRVCTSTPRHASRGAGPLAALALAALLAGCRQPAPPAAPPPSGPAGVGALGRVEPGSGVVVLGARSLSGQPSIVGRLLVDDGDRITAGQPVAHLDSRDQLEAALHQATARIDVARRQLSQVVAGAKPSDVAARKADVARFEAELAAARQEHRRHASLGANVTAAQLDSLQLRIDATAQALEAARQHLASTAETREVDVALAMAQVEAAKRDEARARTELDASIIRSPLTGRVLKVHARAGEQVQAAGIMEVAPTAPMYVVAEVPDSDIARVKKGQRATITSDGLAAAVHGAVERIEPVVAANALMPVDPASFSDGHVVRVWIRVDDPAVVEDRVHLRVAVVIEP
jgi:HlyD family secretion protein